MDFELFEEKMYKYLIQSFVGAIIQFPFMAAKKGCHRSIKFRRNPTDTVDLFYLLLGINQMRMFSKFVNL